MICGDKGLLQATQEACEVWCEDNDDQREEVSYSKSVLSAFAEEIEDFADYVLTDVGAERRKSRHRGGIRVSPKRRGGRDPL